jgi:adenylate kinase family enzyme
VCRGALESRSDDTPQTIRARLDEYHVQAGPILDLFGRKELVATVDGTRGPDNVHRETCEELGLRFTGIPSVRGPITAG